MNETTASEMLARYLEAEAAILSGKSVTFNGRTVSREDLAEIRKGRAEWERKVAAQTDARRGQGGLRYGVARFD